MFKLAVETEFVPPFLYQGPAVVAVLRSGQTAAKEARVILSVSGEQVDALLNLQVTFYPCPRSDTVILGVPTRLY